MWQGRWGRNEVGSEVVVARNLEVSCLTRAEIHAGHALAHSTDHPPLIVMLCWSSKCEVACKIGLRFRTNCHSFCFIRPRSIYPAYLIRLKPDRSSSSCSEYIQTARVPLPEIQLRSNVSLKRTFAKHKIHPFLFVSLRTMFPP